jgi:hypothetical protein
MVSELRYSTIKYPQSRPRSEFVVLPTTRGARKEEKEQAPMATKGAVAMILN